MKTEAIKIGITAVLGFIWSNRKLILAIIPLAFEAQRKFVTGPDKKAWVREQLETVKQFTPDEVDRAIDFVVQLLQAMRVL